MPELPTGVGSTPKSITEILFSRNMGFGASTLDVAEPDSFMTMFSRRLVLVQLLHSISPIPSIGIRHPAVAKTYGKTLVTIPRKKFVSVILSHAPIIVIAPKSPVMSA